VKVTGVPEVTVELGDADRVKEVAASGLTTRVRSQKPLLASLAAVLLSVKKALP
jgi:hypothetical protein